MYDDEGFEDFFDDDGSSTIEDSSSGFAVHKAIRDGAHDRLRRLIMAKAPLETKSSFGQTPLMTACFRKDQVAAEMLTK